MDKERQGGLLLVIGVFLGPLTQLLQQNLDAINEGEHVELSVVRDDEPNGVALPGYILVNDGMFKPNNGKEIIETKEEFLAHADHELTHSRETFTGRIVCCLIFTVHWEEKASRSSG